MLGDDSRGRQIANILACLTARFFPVGIPAVVKQNWIGDSCMVQISNPFGLLISWYISNGDNAKKAAGRLIPQRRRTHKKTAKDRPGPLRR